MARRQGRREAVVREWQGSVRDRFLWALLAERSPGEGLWLGEALGLGHRDWHTGCGDTAFVELVPRDHPHRVRVKGGGYRGRSYRAPEGVSAGQSGCTPCLVRLGMVGVGGEGQGREGAGGGG
ncbi:MAG: hypothetical protein QG671_768, partial [Actinomycetota bacterium]|nr:hypothetical protein [Actinomycetota bacterium]